MGQKGEKRVAPRHRRLMSAAASALCVLALALGSATISPGQENQPGDPTPSASQVAREGYALSKADAERLENQLRTDPQDLAVRTRLLGYYFARSLRLSGPAVTLEARRRHILWVIQHRPDAEVAGMPETTIDPAGHSLADKEGYQAAKALWLKQVEAHRSNTAVLGNAAKFVQLPDKALAERFLKRAQAVDGGWGHRLGYLYALGIMGVDGLNQNGLPTSVNRAEAAGAFARKARREVETSKDVEIVGVAGHVLFLYGFMMRGMGLTQQDHSVLAEQLLKKARALQPDNPAWAEELNQLYEFRRMLRQKASPDS